VNIKQPHSLFKFLSQLCRPLLVLCGAALFLSGCSSSEPTAWTKSSSPWDRPTDNEPSATRQAAEAPATESYKADLGMPIEEPVSREAELSYQAAPVDDFASPPEMGPEADLEPNMVSDLEPPAEVVEESQSAGDTFLDQPADYYTMQLMASVDIDRVMRFAQEEQISTRFIVATVRDGVVWHVLLLDVYADYSSAVAARDEIAPSLKNEPWIRRVSSVQKLMAQ